MNTPPPPQISVLATVLSLPQVNQFTGNCTSGVNYRMRIDLKIFVGLVNAFVEHYIIDQGYRKHTGAGALLAPIDSCYP